MYSGVPFSKSGKCVEKAFFATVLESLGISRSSSLDNQQKGDWGGGGGGLRDQVMVVKIQNVLIGVICYMRQDLPSFKLSMCQLTFFICLWCGENGL